MLSPHGTAQNWGSGNRIRRGNKGKSDFALSKLVYHVTKNIVRWAVGVKGGFVIPHRGVRLYILCIFRFLCFSKKMLNCGYEWSSRNSILPYVHVYNQV